MEWESIDSYTERAKIFGGWLVKATEDVFHSDRGGNGWDWRVSICFVPDPNHEWTITQELDK